MGGWRRWLLVGALALSCFPGVAQAESEVDILLDVLVQNGTITPVQAGQVRRQITETKEARNKQLAKEIVPDSARNWKWSGDIRLREEYRNQLGTGQNVNRQRIRFRVGLDGKVTDDLKVGARLATGTNSTASSPDPVSTNQSFDTALNKKTFNLDRAFVQYTPEVPGINELKLTGGMIENPYWVVGPLVWDEDLTFDGAAVHLAKTIGPVTLFTNNGLFSLKTNITEASALWGTQGGASFIPFANTEDEALKNLKLTGALAYYDYMNVTKKTSENGNLYALAVGSNGGTRGNSANLKDINLINPTVEIASQFSEIPVSAFSDFVYNTAASGQSQGFEIGGKVGKARVPFDVKKGWEMGYVFERLESDAVFGPFTDSDFGNGGTNHQGHVWWLKLAMLKNSDLGLKYSTVTEIKLPKAREDRFQMDWVTKF